ncbi:synaptotagmin-like protein 3 isoform X3 [Pipistrellus kuhlii]|uniref:synaptotagmin-like protein 3 isoform X3 n=1 Tax=Pipistrellus kuhlii TaxID=59472 RepID=UPI00174EFACE|nr:synaptotagmin-like protein 3 isoform X3 [Pipistrellus kuhlii]
MAQEVSLDALQEPEREAILRVLHRDRAVQSVEEERVRKLRAHLQQLRWRGGRGPRPPEKACARCRSALGRLLNRGAVCPGCSHCVCPACRVFLGRPRLWRCTVCYEGRNVRIKTGEWFFEERAKKFPTEELSKSQNDMTSDKQLLSTDPRPGASRTERRSQSDTAINAAPRKVSAPDILMPLSQESPKRSTSPVSKEDGVSAQPAPRTPFSGGSRQGSLISINSTCTEIGNFDNAAVSGEIEFALRYCFETRSLEICIQACRNLAYGEEKRKKCNPYVKTYLLPDRSAQGKRKTAVQRNTVDPTFQETLKYQVEPAQLVTRRLQVSVWHAGTLARRVFLGEVVVPLATWDFADGSAQGPRWHPLRAR